MKEEKHLVEIYGGLREDIRMKTTYVASARPDGLREETETPISCGGPEEPSRKKKEIPGIPVVGRRRTWLQICARLAQQYRVYDSPHTPGSTPPRTAWNPNHIGLPIIGWGSDIRAAPPREDRVSSLFHKS